MERSADKRADTVASGQNLVINTASTTAKGLAQFNAANFTVGGGLVNTIQDITTASSPIFNALSLTGNLTLGTSGIVLVWIYGASGGLRISILKALFGVRS